MDRADTHPVKGRRLELPAVSENSSNPIKINRFRLPRLNVGPSFSLAPSPMVPGIHERSDAGYDEEILPVVPTRDLRTRRLSLTRLPVQLTAGWHEDYEEAPEELRPLLGIPGVDSLYVSTESITINASDPDLWVGLLDSVRQVLLGGQL